MTHTPADHGDSNCPVEALASAWLSYPPAPDLGSFITDGIRTDESCLLELVRIDAQNRVHRNETVRLEFYAQAIASEALGPGTRLARLVLGFERLAGVSAEDMRARLGDAYAADIDAVFSHEESMPPTDIHEATTADVDPVPGSDSPRVEEVRGWAKGDRIGPYKLRKRLGSGGFGEVWLASRRSPDLDVAIKVLKPGVGKDVDRLEVAIDELRSPEGDAPRNEDLAAHLDVSVSEVGRIIDDRETIVRMRAEAQALASLKHPYITTIHDAGTTRGLPYIAMEYVEGKPLVRYCDEKVLPFRQRLELLARVCEGIQHAHQRGLIHRDLKPDNILVTEIIRHRADVDEADLRLVVDRDEQGRVRDKEDLTLAVPKIVDFGLAKATLPTIKLADGTLTVDLGKMMGTAEYMAPEQAGHRPSEVSQQADIFALGVILFELIAGTLPLTREELRQRAIDELVAILRGTPRPEPSTRFSSLKDETRRTAADQRGRLSADELDKLLRGRVRHICTTAMRLEPPKRFSSAAIMGLDIRNYLDDRDFIEAAAESAWEKTFRHVRKHKLPYAAAASVFIALVAGIAGTTWQWQRAEDATIAAIEQRDRAHSVTTFISDLLRTVDPHDVGGPVTADKLLEVAQHRLDTDPQLRDDLEAKVLIQEALGDALVNLGLVNLAIPHYDSALSYWTQRLDVDLRRLASLMDRRAECLADTGQYHLAEAQYRDASATWTRVSGGESTEHELKSEAGRVLPLLYLGRFEESREVLDTVLSRQLQLVGESDEDVLRTLSLLGTWYERREQYREALQVYRDLATRQRATVETRLEQVPQMASDGHLQTCIRTLVRYLRDQAYQAAQLKLYDEADDLFREATSLLDAHPNLFTRSHPTRLYLRLWSVDARSERLTQSQEGDEGSHVAARLLEFDRFEERDSLLGELGLELTREVDDPIGLEVALDPHAQAARAEMIAACLYEYRRVIEDFEEVFGPNSTHTLTARGNYAIFVMTAISAESARQMLDHVIPRLRQLHGTHSHNTLHALYMRAQCHEAHDDYDAAIRDLEEAFTAARSISLRHPELPDLTRAFYRVRASAAKRSGNEDAVRRVIEEEVAVWEAQAQAWDDVNDHLAQARRRHAAFLTAQGDLDRAKSILVQVLTEQRKELGEDHPSTTESRIMLANVLYRQGTVTH